MDKNKKIIISASLILAFFLIFLYAFFPLGVGISENGSIPYIEKGLGIEKKVQTEYFSKEYTVTSFGDLSYYNGSMLSYLKPLKIVSNAVLGEFNTGILAIFYSVLLLISLYILMKYIKFDKMWKNITFAGILIFVFCDVAYLVYLNTLFQEGAFYIFFVLSIALYVKLIADDKPKIPSLVCFFLSAMVLTGLKPNMWIIGVLFAILGVMLVTIRKGLIFRILTIALTILIIIQPFIAYKKVSEKEYKYNLFNSVFYGILLDNKNVDKTLTHLGISSEFSSYAGMSAYDVDSNVVAQATSNLHYGKVIGYYIKNPVDYIKKFNISANNGFEIRPRYLGNYQQSSGKGANELVGGFALYSTVKRILAPANLLFVWLFPLILIGICLIFRKRDEKHSMFYYMVSCIATMSIFVFHIPAITYGQAELGRHMSIYSTVFDVLIISAIVLLIHITAIRRAEFKEKYGQTQ